MFRRGRDSAEEDCDSVFSTDVEAATVDVQARPVLKQERVAKDGSFHQVVDEIFIEGVKGV
jgi:hypothetical protein